MASIKFPEGTTFRQQYTLFDTNNAIISLAGASLTFAAYVQSAAKTGIPSAYISKTVGNGVTILNSSGGIILITFNPLDTVDGAGVYDWELQLLEINGDKWLAGGGVLLIQPARRLDTT